MIQIEESNPSFESCDKCIYSDDSEETCILRRCIHAVSQLKECYIPKQRIEPERKKGKWTGENACEFCGFQPWYERDIHTLSYCPNCGADMRGR